MSSSPPIDPYRILGLPPDAGETEVRTRYLQLVKQFPPDRDPEKFREIRTAFEAAKDPLSIAKHLLAIPDEEPPEWADTLEMQRHIPPRMSPGFILSLGNRDGDEGVAAARPGSA